MAANPLIKELDLNLCRIVCRKCGHDLKSTTGLSLSIELDNRSNALGFKVSDKDGFVVRVEPCPICTEEL